MPWTFSDPADSYEEDKSKLHEWQQNKITELEGRIKGGEILGVRRGNKIMRYLIPPHVGNEIIGKIVAEPSDTAHGIIQFIHIQIQVWI